MQSSILKISSYIEKYKKENKELRIKLPTLARAIAIEILCPKMLEALVPIDLYHLIRILRFAQLILEKLSETSLGNTKSYWVTPNDKWLTRRCRSCHALNEANL